MRGIGGEQSNLIHIMKHLITDTDISLEGINTYLIEELKKTNLNEEDIVIEDALKVKIGMMELSRIFNENDMESFLTIDVSPSEGCIHLTHTGHNISFSRDEIDYRFHNAYECILTGLKEKKA
jgi:hypothetical protein